MQIRFAKSKSPLESYSYGLSSKCFDLLVEKGAASRGGDAQLAKWKMLLRIKFLAQRVRR